MTIINVSDIEDLVLAKYKIEESLLSSGKIKEKSSLNDFISKYLHFGENAFLLDENYIYPFSLINVENNLYLFITESETSETSKKFLNILKNINYDLDNLKDINQDELPDYNKFKIFIINSKYKKLAI